MQRLAILALAISLVALALSIVTYLQADAHAEAALRRREKALVQRYTGPIRQASKELGIPVNPTEPETLEELAEPMQKLLAGLSK
jgi:hypothetical protein